MSRRKGARRPDTTGGKQDHIAYDVFAGSELEQALALGRMDNVDVLHRITAAKSDIALA